MWGYSWAPRGSLLCDYELLRRWLLLFLVHQTAVQSIWPMINREWLHYFACALMHRFHHLLQRRKSIKMLIIVCFVGTPWLFWAETDNLLLLFQTIASAAQHVKSLLRTCVLVWTMFLPLDLLVGSSKLALEGQISCSFAGSSQAKLLGQAPRWGRSLRRLWLDKEGYKQSKWV